MTKPTGKPQGRPPVADPWAKLQVYLRASDLARLKAIAPDKGEASIWVREVILDRLKPV